MLSDEIQLGRRPYSSDMLAICGIYDVATRVRDLAKSEVFYRETLGLEVSSNVVGGCS